MPRERGRQPTVRCVALGLLRAGGRCDESCDTERVGREAFRQFQVLLGFLARRTRRGRRTAGGANITASHASRGRERETSGYLQLWGGVVYVIDVIFI